MVFLLIFLFLGMKNKIYCFPDLTRAQAERLLARSSAGTFLVRQSTSEIGNYYFYYHYYYFFKKNHFFQKKNTIFNNRCLGFVVETIEWQYFALDSSHCGANKGWQNN